ncbi:hypothetical protein RFI_14737, partial [Reticulomyxa filosa]
EIREIQAQVQQSKQELKSRIEETGANVLAFKKEMETVMKQLNVDECNLNLRVAQLIQHDPMNRKMVEWIIGKFTMTGATLLNNVPTLGFAFQLVDYVVGIVGRFKSQEWFKNVLSFENKNFTGKHWILPKLFALKLFAIQEFE